MNCQSLQNRILALPDPRQVPESLRPHLDACPACRVWWQQATRLERLLENLPAPPPPADKKAALIDDLTAAGPIIKSIPAAPRPAGRVSLAATRGAKAVAGLAAAVLIGIGGWQLIKPTGTAIQAQTAPRHPLLEKVVQRDLALAKVNTPAQRLEVLSGLADDLSSETRGLARIGTPDDLNDLATWFQKVVADGIVPQAGKLPPGMAAADKRAILDRLTAKLAEAGQEANRAVGVSPPQSHAALKKIVETAQDGQKKLREILAREGA